jgi:hypothetical protein
MAQYITFQPSDHFNTKLYTGNGSAGNSITGVGFQPDWVWIKNRGNTESHALFDAVRGVTKRIASNSTGAEETNANTVTAFGTDGFTVGTNAGVNGNGISTVAWNWKANGSGSANTDGTISSTVSANTTSGFSIVKYTGTGANATVGHGLGAVPQVYWVKSLGHAQGAYCYFSSLGNNKQLLLSSNDAAGTTTLWNTTSPTSTVFSLSSDHQVNGSYDFIAYCFAEKKGYSKFGSYTGNGNADGTFVYTGFKPAFVMYKNSSVAGGHWQIYDNKRLGYNGANKVLRANLNNAEADDEIDLLSNGFKCRDTNNNNNNHNGVTYIYMAFAEHPLVSSNDIPSTAR